MATTKKATKTKARLAKALGKAKNEARAAKAKRKPPAKGPEVPPYRVTYAFNDSMDMAELNVLSERVGTLLGCAPGEALIRLCRGHLAERETERRQAEDVALGCLVVHGRGAMTIMLQLAPSTSPAPDDASHLALRFRQGVRPMFVEAARIYRASLVDPIDATTVAKDADQGAYLTMATKAFMRWNRDRTDEGFAGDADALPREALAVLVALEPHAERAAE